MLKITKLIKGGLKVAALIVGILLLYNHPGIRFFYLTEVHLPLKCQEAGLDPKLVKARISEDLNVFDLQINETKAIPKIFFVSGECLDMIAPELWGLYVHANYFSPKIFIKIGSPNANEVLTHEIFHYVIRNYGDVEEKLVEELTAAKIFGIKINIPPRYPTAP